MAKRLNGAALYMICSLMFLQTMAKQLDSECVKRYSASYKKNATQESSPDQKNHLAIHAVDGDDRTCSRTIETTGGRLPWWKVNLDRKINIMYIQVKNSQWHPTATIRIYVRYEINSKGHSCGSSIVLAAGESRIIRCKPAQYGRSVIIVGPGSDFLSLCEVQVFDDSVRVTEGVTYEVWFNKTDIYQLLNLSPDSRSILPTFDAPRSIFDRYGVKMKTYFNAPQSGIYHFNLTGDNKCSLYIQSVVKEKREPASVARIPDPDSDRIWTWDESVVVSVNLTKGMVYELTALMVGMDKANHARVGVTFPNGAFVRPMNSRIFVDEDAARNLTKNSCSQGDGTIVPTFSSPKPTRPTTINTDNAIEGAVSRLLNDKIDNVVKFQTLEELESLGFEKAQALVIAEGKPFAFSLVQKNDFVFAAVALNMSTGGGFNFPQNLETFNPFPDYSSISFSKGAFPSGQGRTSAVFMMFKPLQEMLEQTGRRQHHLSSNVISASLEKNIETNMTKPFTLIFRNTEVIIEGQRHCVYWIEDNDQWEEGKFGRWSDQGCSLVQRNDTHTTCECNHLTKFTILFPVAEGSEEHEMKLELITYVGLSLSSVGCFITFAVYLILRITKTLKTIVHLNLVLALGLADLVFLFGNLAERDKKICFASTVLTFYLYLAVFAWMLVEGLHLYFLVIRVFGSDNHRRRKYYHVIGWGIPLVIVAVTTGILRYDLMSEKHCWLSTKSASIWVFIGPALFVIVVNTLILAAVLRTTMTLLRNDPGHRKEKSAMRTLAMLVPILGTTWVFGVVAFAKNSIVFQYVFAACNAFQGVFIFILYCLFNTEVRHEYQRKRKAWKTERELDSKRSPQNNSFDL